MRDKDGCKGYIGGNPSTGFYYDCEYEFSGKFDCQDCIFGSCGGMLDPRPRGVDK